jgi:hypothetical protein
MELIRTNNHVSCDLCCCITFQGWQMMGAAIRKKRELNDISTEWNGIYRQEIPTPWSKDLLHKLILLQLLEKFLAFYRLKRTNMYTRACIRSPSWARWSHSTLSHPMSLKIHLNTSINLPSRPRPSKRSLPLNSSDRNIVRISDLLHAKYMPCPSHSP